MVGQQQFVLLPQAVGMPVGRLGVDLVPLRELLADRPARCGPVPPLLTFGSNVVGGAPGPIVIGVGGGQVDGQRVDLGGDVTLIDVIRLFERTTVVLDGQPVGVLVEAGVGDRAAEAGKTSGVSTQR